MTTSKRPTMTLTLMTWSVLSLLLLLHHHLSSSSSSSFRCMVAQALDPKRPLQRSVQSPPSHLFYQGGGGGGGVDPLREDVSQDTTFPGRLYPMPMRNAAAASSSSSSSSWDPHEETTNGYDAQYRKTRILPQPPRTPPPTIALVDDSETPSSKNGNNLPPTTQMTTTSTTPTTTTIFPPQGPLTDMILGAVGASVIVSPTLWIHHHQLAYPPSDHAFWVSLQLVAWQAAFFANAYRFVQQPSQLSQEQYQNQLQYHPEYIVLMVFVMLRTLGASDQDYASWIMMMYQGLESALVFGAVAVVLEWNGKR